MQRKVYFIAFSYKVLKFFVKGAHVRNTEI